MIPDWSAEMIIHTFGYPVPQSTGSIRCALPMRLGQQKPIELQRLPDQQPEARQPHLHWNQVPASAFVVTLVVT